MAWTILHIGGKRLPSEIVVQIGCPENANEVANNLITKGYSVWAENRVSPLDRNAAERRKAEQFMKRHFTKVAHVTDFEITTQYHSDWE